MEVKLGATIHRDFVTSDATGAAADATGTPTCEVFEDANDTAILSPTVTKRTGKTGNYRVPIACTSGNGFEAGKSYNVVVSAVVAGVTSKAVLASFEVRSKSVDDLDTDAVLLAAAGLDLVSVEAGTVPINARQALAECLALLAGAIQDANTTNPKARAAGYTGLTGPIRASFTVPGDGSGNRSAVVLTPPA